MKIFVRLLNEGTDVFRPVQAFHIGDERYQILDSNVRIEDEEWEFEPGMIVEAIMHRFASGESGLLATKAVPS
jgi:hypothetical protein